MMQLLRNLITITDQRIRFCKSNRCLRPRNSRKILTRKLNSTSVTMKGTQKLETNDLTIKIKEPLWQPRSRRLKKQSVMSLNYILQYKCSRQFLNQRLISQVSTRNKMPWRITWTVISPTKMLRGSTNSCRHKIIKSRDCLIWSLFTRTRTIRNHLISNESRPVVWGTYLLAKMRRPSKICTLTCRNYRVDISRNLNFRNRSISANTTESLICQNRWLNRRGLLYRQSVRGMNLKSMKSQLLNWIKSEVSAV